MESETTDEQEIATNAELEDRLETVSYLVDDLFDTHHGAGPVPSSLEERLKNNEETIEIMHGLIVKLIDIVDQDIESEREALEAFEDTVEQGSTSDTDRDLDGFY